MIINYLPSNDFNSPNPSQVVADLAAKEGVNVTTNLQGQMGQNDLVIWQYDQDTASSQYISIEQGDPGTRLVLWVNDFDAFIADNQAKNYLNMADYIVVPTKAARDKVVADGFDINHVTEFDVFDCPIQWELNDKVPYARDVHQIKLGDSKTPWQELIKSLNTDGGFALVQNDSSYNSPLELSVAIEAGIPVIAKAGTVTADVVVNQGIGFVYKDEELPQNLAATVKESQYDEYAKNVKALADRLRNGDHLAGILNNAIFYSRIHHNLFDEYTSIYTKSEYNLRVMDNEDTLDFIDRYHPSIARIGHYEVALINGNKQPLQDPAYDLCQKLDAVAKKMSSNKLLVCLDDVFYSLALFSDHVQDRWKNQLNTYKNYYESLTEGGFQNVYGNAMLTTPYINFKDHSQAAHIFKRIKQWWQDRDILVVEGYYTRSGVGNDLFDNAKSVSRVICPDHNAWDKHDQIVEAIKKYGKDKLILLAVDSTSAVLAAELADWGQVIDLGYIDRDYAWSKMGVTTPVTLANKLIPGLNEETDVSNTGDQSFLDQIVVNLSGKQEA